MARKPKVDIARLKEQHSPEAVAERYALALHTQGGRIVSACPFHEDPSPSFTVYPDHFYCYGCQWHGDVLDFVAGMEGLELPRELPKAAAILTGEEPLDHSMPVRDSVPRGTLVELTPVLPVPKRASDIKAGVTTPPIFNATKGKAASWSAPAAVHRYFDYNNAFMGVVLRAEFNGKKITPQVMWCEWGEGKRGWALQTFPVPRPLYRPPLLPGARDDQDARWQPPVLIVEGEKAADAAAKLLGHLYDVVTWPGGGHGVNLAAWELLGGRSVLLWPDADEPGYKAMGKLGAILSRMEPPPADVRVVATMQDPAPETGWDLADPYDWAADQVIEWARPRAYSWEEGSALLQLPEADSPLRAKPEPPQQRQDPKVEQPPPESEPPAPPPEPDDLVEVILGNPHFRTLGYDNDHRWFLPNGKDKTQKPVGLRVRDLDQKNLQQLADLDWWRKLFPSGEHGISWQLARQGLLNASGRAGLYDRSEERGRGAWLEDEIPLFHSGEKVWRAGETFEPGHVPSRFIYPRQTEWGIDVSQPVSDDQAQRMSSLIQQLSWEKEAFGLMMVGWVVLAPVCGMLKWRPHVWITGASGSGKTTTLNLVERVLGKCAMRAENITTEAGLRQDMGCDARPVLFDEAEAEDQRSATRLRQILDFVRVASSGGKVTKGTTTGSPMKFTVRACFCLSAINPSAIHRADTSRISQLVLINEGQGGAEFYKYFIKKVSDEITPFFAAGMLARTVQNMAKLRTNILTFSDAATATLHNARLGDQVGSLMAGARFCENTDLVTFDEAVAFIERLDFSDTTESAKATDEDRLLHVIMMETRRVSGNRGPIDMTIAELAEIVALAQPAEGVEIQAAIRALGMMGLKVNQGDQSLAIANKSEKLASLLANTPWSKGWSRALRDLEGATQTGSIYFWSGLRGRGTYIPGQHWLNYATRPNTKEGEEDDES